ncbi:MAG: Calx-beta domain-containing protein, partial [Pyrinomonadaceae bacterium]
TFTATVSSGAGTPTGTVQFKDNGNNLGAPVALAGGVAQFTTSALTVGTHTITADYSGDVNFLVSTGTLSGGQVVRPQPSLSINDVSISEGNSGTKTLTFTVTLSAASNLTVTANYATANGSATEPSDYLSTNGTLTFNPGDTSKPVSVTINGDVSFEADETFTVNLSSPVNATIADNQGTGTIQNDDVLGGFISFSNVSYSVNENAGVVTVTVVRTNDTTQPVTVDYATDDTGASTNCATLLTGLASQRCDYTTLLGTLKFAANETQKTLDIPINQDAYAEGPETFTVNLSNPASGAVLAVPTTAIVTINDSASPTPNAIDDTNNFVRQQYRDFLNREADPAGLAFWVNNIDKCNDPLQRPAGQTLAQCIEVQRILTSAAFFLSIEFKQTGGTVREFYVAALDRPATNNMPNYLEFMRDTQAIQRGVVVGQGNWQQVLDANRTAFMNEFVTRAEFVGLYPTTDTPTQYVDKLYLHANVVPGNAQERLDAIAEFGGAPTAANAGARGRALLRITQNAAFQTRETNRTFVQIEYFGYLRRNPNDLPDGNFNGYNFWVNKLNQFNGDFLKAEMVKAFLNSLEYRSRFGP